MSSFLLSLVVTTATGTILLWLLTKRISGIQISIGTAFGVSLTAQAIIVLISFSLDFVFLYHPGLAVTIAVALGLYFQALLLKIAMRATGRILSARKAYILSLIVVLADFFVASPLVMRISLG
jgi:hypothetical protein